MIQGKSTGVQGDETLCFSCWDARDEHRDTETQSFWCQIAPIFTLTMVIFDRTAKGDRVAHYVL